MEKNSDKAAKIRGYYFVTDSNLSKKGTISDCMNAAVAGINIIQYRNKDASTRSMLSEALKIKKICIDRSLLIINDRLDIALAADADGVHLGQDDMPYEVARKMLGPDKIIGITVHSMDEARDAIKKGADYLGVSPIFETKTKLDAGAPKGITLIKDIRKLTSVPLVAIGGINLENAKAVIDAGVDAVCAISAVVCSDDVRVESERFNALFFAKPANIQD